MPEASACARDPLFREDTPDLADPEFHGVIRRLGDDPPMPDGSTSGGSSLVPFSRWPAGDATNAMGNALNE